MKLEWQGKKIVVEIDPSMVFCDEPDEWHISQETFFNAVGSEMTLHVSYERKKGTGCVGIHGILTGIRLEDRDE